MAWLENNSWLLIAVSLLAFALSALARWYSNWRGLIDMPGQRRSHQQPTARGGGMAIALSIIITLIWLLVADQVQMKLFVLFGFGLIALAALGWVDDHRSIPARFRLLSQLIINSVVIASFYALNGPIEIMTGTLLLIVLMLGIVIAMSWLVNLVNFMDGSNGLAAMQGVFCCVVFCTLFFDAGDYNAAIIAAIAAAAIIGFMPWNWPVARLFMGDSGSYSIGFILAFFYVYGFWMDLVSLCVIVLIMSLFLIDTTATLILRVLRKQQWYTAHREHAYQRLLMMGMSHTSVMLIYAGFNILFILPVLVYILRDTNKERLAVILVLITLLSLWACVQRYWFKAHNNKNAE